MHDNQGSYVSPSVRIFSATFFANFSLPFTHFRHGKKIGGSILAATNFVGRDEIQAWHKVAQMDVYYERGTEKKLKEIL